MHPELSSLTDLPVSLRGFFLGLALSAPVGPIGLLCIRRTIDKGPLSGLVTGLGAATVDTFFATLAAFGLSTVIDWMMHYNNQLRLIGGIIMLVMAYSVWSDNTTEASAGSTDERAKVDLVHAATSGFALTITNPVTIIAVIALVTTFGADTGGKFAATVLVMGVLAGACSWWALLVGMTTLLRKRFSPNTISHINHFTAMLLSFFGVWVLFYTLGQLMPHPLGYYLQQTWPLDRLAH